MKIIKTDTLKRLKGSKAVKAHITLGLTIQSIGSIVMPSLAVELVAIGLLVNIVWVWEG